MQAFRLGLRTAFRATARSVPRRPPAQFLQPAQQTRFASRYQRFGNKNDGSQQSWSRFGPAYRVQYIWRNYRTTILLVSGGGVVVYAWNQESVPVTGRRRFNVVPPDLEKQIAGGQYDQIVSQFKGQILPPEHPYTQLWKVHVIDDPDMMNAFVIPGGKVFVFTGILPICKDEDGVAAVLGHEIAHNVAHHVSERMSQSVITMAFALVVSLLLDVSGGLAQDVASLLLSMPNSRTQEKEADHIGLLMMAEACYDPKSAIDLWTRMAEKEKGAPPQFMSTHPTSYNRRELIRGWIPQAEAKFEEGGCAATFQHKQGFMQAARMRDSGQRGERRAIPVQQRPSGSGGDDDYFF
ncbi:Mitochondrial metalloendopeptidase OMA1 [Cyphellophora attinorum]|uniref:Mitochondrial metalloendopeptidase OMA1 n=1 Tax=Cyphellophora attinorum TaxID=1664694 RepID=A0A0N0NMA4_9EURO|nr:Mitochondrial metalloendopeptidase OMA1 [Phialophora attinorum]KPI40118.1 Mitochondrial metalloendopeptidase OMA1 [Phialophora attinorum]